MMATRPATLRSVLRALSTVLIISDSRQSVGVEDTAGNKFGLTGHGINQPLALTSLSASPKPARVGAVLTTSGQTNGNPAALYPAGIPVGVVATSVAHQGGVASGTVRPIVDVDTLEFVTVLEWLPSA